MQDDNKYSDIINLPHHVSDKHPRMSNHDRAAQFAPFAALTGFDAGVNKAAEENVIKVEQDNDLSCGNDYFDI